MKLHAEATTRNREPIARVLDSCLPPTGLVLEVASGTGEHAVFFARRFAALQWQPSEVDPAARASIAAWSTEAGLDNLRPPLALDVLEAPWPIETADALVNINMIHIAPWAVCEALLDGAARLLPPQGLLYLYGPYMLGGRHNSEGNARFDRALRARDPRLGLRDVDEVVDAAATRNLRFVARAAMPANNQSLLFRRA